MAYELAKAYVQIIPTTKGIKGELTSILDSEADAAGRSAGSRFGSSFGGVLKTAGKAIAGILVAGTAAMATFTKSAIEAGMSFDSSMSQVAATMGKTMDELNSDIRTIDLNGQKWTGNLRDYAKKMGSETMFSATQAADALNYMALAGYDVQTSMEMLPNVLNLAAAGNMDLARASDMVTDTQSALGLSLSETNVMVDQWAKAASKSNTSVEQLGEAFLKIGATARNVKGGTEELSTVLGVLADNGIKGSEGGTHLRNILLSLQNAAEDGAVDFGDFAVSIYDADGNMRSMIDIIEDMQDGMSGMSQEAKDAMISGVFNRTDLASVNALLGTTKTRFDELTDAIADSNGAAQQMAETQLDNLAGDITIMKSAFEGLQISISDGATPALRESVQGITEVINGMNDLVSGVEGGSARIKAGFQQILSGVKTALPEVMEMFGSLMQAVLEMLPDIVEQIVRMLPGLFSKLMDSIGVLIPRLVELLPSFVEAFSQIIVQLGSKLSELVVPLITALAKAIVECIPTVIKSVAELVRGVTLGLLGIEDPIKKVNEKMSSIGEQAKTSWQEIQDTMSKPINMDGLLAMSSEIDASINEIEGKITEIYQMRFAEQEGLRQEDIENIKAYNAQIEELENQKLSIYDRQASGRLAIMQRMEDATLADYMTQLGMLQQYDAQERAELEEYYASKMGLAEQTREQEMAAAQQAYEVEKTITEQQYQELIAAADAHYDEMTGEVQSYYDEHIAAINSREAEAMSLIADSNHEFVQNLQTTYADAAAANSKWLDAVVANGNVYNNEMIVTKMAAEDATNALINSMDEADAQNTAAWLSMIAQVKAGGGEISGDMKTTTETILNAFDGMPSQMQEAGGDMLAGLTIGMVDQIPELDNASNMTAQEIVDVIKAYLGINSPSTVMNEIGQNTIAGLVQGIRQNAQSAQSAMQNVGSALIQGIGSGMQAYQGWLGTIAYNAVANAVASAKAAGQIASPSKVMRNEVGLMLSEGMALGIEDGEPEIIAAIGEIGEEVNGAFDDVSLMENLIGESIGMQQSVIGRMTLATADAGQQIRTAVMDTDMVAGGNRNDSLTEILAVLLKYLPDIMTLIAERKGIDADELASLLAAPMSKKLGKLERMNGRGVCMA